MGAREWEILHRFGFIEDAKTADGGFRGILEIEQVFESEFFEFFGSESGEFRARERPGHLALRIGWFATAGDDEQETARAEEPGDIFDGPGAERGWQDLATLPRSLS